MQKRTKFQIRSDASKQRWVRDDRKEAFWRNQIKDWKLSGLSKRAFCIANDLSQSSFNAWCREIELRDREKAPSANAKSLLDVESPFVPLRLLPDERTVEEQAPPTKDVGREKQAIEILVPGGAIVRVGENCSIKFVSDLVSSLKG